MISWPPETWTSGRTCDVPDCGRESSADNLMISRPVIGRTLDHPLCLFYCDDHKDFSSLVERYRVAILGGGSSPAEADLSPVESVALA
jgi:hypothetical protein